LRSLRAQAYVILAWGHLWASGIKNIEPIETVAFSAARRLVECYDRSRRPDWPWFESRMTYANAVLPHALFVAAQRWPNETFLEVAETSFAFLDHVTTAPPSSPIVNEHRPSYAQLGNELDNVFWPVGNSGWFPHGEDKALYDQQPIEAVTMAEAALAAFYLLSEQKYLVTFRRAHGWFHGQNSLGQPMVNVTTGACADGLQPSQMNRNQGAESTLAYLWTELHNLELQQAIGDGPADAAATA
jgi:hypothetical protein